MSSFHGKYFPPIADGVMFERFTAMLWQKMHPESTAVLMGRSGQAQSGIDVLVTTRTGKTIGVQCKAVKRLTEKMLLKEVEKALQFQPMIDQFVLATTSPHDVVMVTAAQRLSGEHSEKSPFPVTVFGWGELLRLAEPHPEVIQHFYREFDGDSKINATRLVSLTIEPDLSVAMDNVELALFCSETAAKLAEDDRTVIQVNYTAESALRSEIALLNADVAPTIELRLRRSDRVAALAHISPRRERLELAISILLTDNDVRSPWLIGPDWLKTATTLRSLVPDILRPRIVSDPEAMTLKIRSQRTQAIVTWLHLDEREQVSFCLRNPNYSPSYFLGGVYDLGDELGLKALSAGIAAVLQYSAGHKVPLDTLRANGEMLIFEWSVEAA